MTAISNPIIKVQGKTLELPKKYNATNYFICSMGVFQKVDELPANVIFIHQSEDSTYYTSPCKKFLYRVSNHWALQECEFIGSCFWVLNGYENNYKIRPEKQIGVIKFSALKNIPATVQTYINYKGKVRIKECCGNEVRLAIALKLFQETTEIVKLNKGYAIAIRITSGLIKSWDLNKTIIIRSNLLRDVKKIASNIKEVLKLQSENIYVFGNYLYENSIPIYCAWQNNVEVEALGINKMCVIDIFSCKKEEEESLISKLLGL